MTSSENRSTAALSYSGRIKSTPEDFIVDEIPLYEPSGEGAHLFIRFQKRNLTTDDAVRKIASALKARIFDIGVAGLKDKVAVTTQTISVPVPPGDLEFEARASSLSLEGVTTLSVKRHGNKVRTGHLRGNRFSIRIRGVNRIHVPAMEEKFHQIAREGIPNAFGAQRFGRGGDNAERAREWLSGRAPAPRAPKMRRFLFSSLQSAVFNAVLEARVQDGTWATPLLGDVLKLRESGGLFVCDDVERDQLRARTGELSPTGPIFGVKMRNAQGVPGALEQSVMKSLVGEEVDLNAHRVLGEGTRRPFRLWVEDARFDAPGSDVPVSDRPVRDVPRGEGENFSSRAPIEEEVSICVGFVLPKGAYATTVLSQFVAFEEVTPSGIQSETSPRDSEESTDESGATSE